MARKENWQTYTLAANPELKIVHRHNFIDSGRDPGLGCIRWLIVSLIVEAVLCIAVVLCWRPWFAVT